MRVQRSPINTTRCYVSRLFNTENTENNDNHFENRKVRSVFCAPAEAFFDQVCRTSPSRTGRRAALITLNEKPRIVPELYERRVS